MSFHDVVVSFDENIPPLFDKIESLSQNYLLLKQGGHYGLCDFGGNIILDVDFNEIRISNNYLRVNKNGFHGVYKLDGTPFIIPEKYTNIRMTDTGFEAEVRPKGSLTPLESIFISFEGTKLDIAERERLLEEYEQEGDKAFEKEAYDIQHTADSFCTGLCCVLVFTCARAYKPKKSSRLHCRASK